MKPMAIHGIFTRWSCYDDEGVCLPGLLPYQSLAGRRAWPRKPLYIVKSLPDAKGLCLLVVLPSSTLSMLPFLTGGVQQGQLESDKGSAR
jgi:hypothetical protein